MVGDPGKWHFVSYFALKPEAQAAWAQAWLTLFAIGVAILVPALQTCFANRRKALDSLIEGRELANLILPAIKDWTVRVAVLAGRARAGDVVDVYYRRESAFEIPRTIQEQIGKLHLLGQAALPLQDALHLAIGAGNTWDSYNDAAKGDLEGDLRAKAIRDGHDAVYRLKGLLLVASTAIEAMFTAPGGRKRKKRRASPWGYSEEVNACIRNDRLGEAKE